MAERSFNKAMNIFSIGNHLLPESFYQPPGGNSRKAAHVSREKGYTSLKLHRRSRSMIVHIHMIVYFSNKLRNLQRTMRRMMQVGSLTINQRQPPLHCQRKFPPRVQTVFVVKGFGIGRDIISTYQYLRFHGNGEVVVVVPLSVCERGVLVCGIWRVAFVWYPAAHHGFESTPVGSGLF